MKLRKKLSFIGKLIVTVIFLATSVSAISMILLYRTSVQEKSSLLLNVARTNASLIDAVAEFDIEFSEDALPGGAYAATLRQLENAYSGAMLHDAVIEIHVVARSGESINFLVHQHENATDKEHPNFVDATHPYAIPILAAISGQSGVVEAYNSQGELVIMAYAPVTALGVAVVAEVYKSDLVRPFIEMTFWISILSVVIIGCGVFIIYRTATPLVEQAEYEAQRFRQFADTAADWFWETDQKHRFTRVGREHDPEGVISPSKVTGKTRWDVAEEDTNGRKWRDHKETLDAHRPFRNFQYEVRGEGGSPRSITVSGEPAFDRKGRFVGYRGSARDITGQLRRQRRLALAEHRLQTTFDSIAIGIILVDDEGTIEGFNPAAERMFGYQAVDVIGKNVSVLMPDDHAKAHDGYMKRYGETGKAGIIGIGRELMARRKDGSLFPIHLALGEMRMEDERHFIGSVSDLSNAKSVEAQLRRSQKMEAVGQLTGGIAHDFNNLLGIVIGNLDLARRGIEPESKLARQIGKAIGAAERGAVLTRRLLKFSRQAPEENEPVNVNEAIRDVQEMVARSLRVDIAVELSLADEAWPAAINRGDFEDALINLCINARDAMPHGGTLTIETRNTAIVREGNPAFEKLSPGDYLEVAVTDTGCGMPPEVVNRIFEPFFTTKDAGKGTGLGMAMVYGFVQRSKGTISVYSEEGLGTTFRLYLPRADSNNSDLSFQGDAADRSEDVPEGHGERVLVVDDEPDLAELGATILTDLGYKVTVSLGGEEALARLESGERFDLIVSDVVMPGSVGGYDLVDKARALHPDQRILLVSGYTGGLAAKQTENAPTLLRKPYTNDELARTVRRELDHDRH